MKTILTAMMLALSLQAFAGEVVVYDAPTYETRGYSDVKASFGINKDLGRSWVTLNFVPEYNQDLMPLEERVLLFPVYRNEELIEKAKAKVLKARTFLQELEYKHLNFNK